MKYLTLVLATILLSFKTHAQGKIFATEDGAISGYDPVAYFTDSQPVKGSREYALVWREATWFFKSAEHLELFKANPEKYAPQFGGFCSYGVSRNYKVKSEPDAWSIVDGKLYLNYNTEVQKKWLTDKENYILKANQNWLTLENKGK
jgi:YHS domain-containing protein